MTNKKTKKDTILVLVDFSPPSEAAIAYAGELATQLNVPLTVLHVIHDPGESPGYYAPKKSKKHLRMLEDVANDMMNDFLLKVVKDNPDLKALQKAEPLLISGLPVTRMIQMIEKLNPYMVVMGNQGRSALELLMMGSKAEQVVRLSPVPVTVVKSK